MPEGTGRADLRRRPTETPAIHMQMRKLPRPAGIVRPSLPPSRVPASLGLTYANFRKTLTGRSRVIDTDPPVRRRRTGQSVFPLGSYISILLAQLR